jgi:2-iminobutanoate/2-iminopropanoate deaminase
MPAHKSVSGPGLPTPAGPYSPAVTFERLVFVAGQGAGNPATNQLAGDDIESQTEQCFTNIAAILEAAGSSLGHVLKVSVFLVDMADFARMNTVYERRFGRNRPARTTIQAAALPMPELRVEIDCIAYVP